MNGFRTETESVKIHPGRTVEVTVDLKEDESSQPVALGSLTGIVTDASGNPVAGAVVRAGRQTALTDAQGKYTLTGVRAGSVAVEVSKRDFRTLEATASVSADATTTLNLSLVAKSRDDRPVQGTGSLSGTVFNAAGQPMGGALVMLRGVRLTTDATGRFQFPNLRSGIYSLQVWADGFRHTHKRVEVGDGETITVEVTLLPKTPSSSDSTDDKGGDSMVGDANADGEVTLSDVIAALRIALSLDIVEDERGKARLDVAPPKPRGDFGDDKIDIKDVLKLLRVVTKLDKVLP
jgi:protocatechuate 3,4-dioxygenase beta subunit